MSKEDMINSAIPFPEFTPEAKVRWEQVSVPVNSEQEGLDPSTWLRASSLRAGKPRQCGKNTKSEARDPKQIRMTKA